MRRRLKCSPRSRRRATSVPKRRTSWHAPQNSLERRYVLVCVARRSVHEGCRVARRAPEEPRVERVAAVADPEGAGAVLGARAKHRAGHEGRPRRVAFVLVRACGPHRADRLVAHRARDAFERRWREHVTQRRARLARTERAPRRHARREVLARRVAVDAPVLAARARHAVPVRSSRHTSAPGERSTPAPIGHRDVAADLLLDDALERAEERALARVRHHRALPLGHLARMTARAVLRLRAVERHRRDANRLVVTLRARTRERRERRDEHARDHDRRGDEPIAPLSGSLRVSRPRRLRDQWSWLALDRGACRGSSPSAACGTRARSRRRSADARSASATAFATRATARRA